MRVPKLQEDARYVQITNELRVHHKELLQLEREGRLKEVKDSPLIGDYLTKLRLNVNLLFAFINNYLDVHSDLTVELAEKRQKLYIEQLEEGKTPSAAETHSKQLTRVDEATVKVVENQMQQLKNEYERFNGICMMLQSRLREFNTERVMG
jgi:hypothetical protein